MSDWDQLPDLTGNLPGSAQDLFTNRFGELAAFRRLMDTHLAALRTTDRIETVPSDGTIRVDEAVGSEPAGASATIRADAGVVRIRNTAPAVIRLHPSGPAPGVLSISA